MADHVLAKAKIKILPHICASHHALTGVEVVRNVNPQLASFFLTKRMCYKATLNTENSEALST